MNATESRIVAGTGVFGSWVNLLKYPAAIVGQRIELNFWRKKKCLTFFAIYSSLE